MIRRMQTLILGIVTKVTTFYNNNNRISIDTSSKSKSDSLSSPWVEFGRGIESESVTIPLKRTIISKKENKM
jgi:hypothetical protein